LRLPSSRSSQTRRAEGRGRHIPRSQSSVASRLATEPNPRTFRALPYCDAAYVVASGPRRFGRSPQRGGLGRHRHRGSIPGHRPHTASFRVADRRQEARGLPEAAWPWCRDAWRTQSTPGTASDAKAEAPRPRGGTLRPSMHKYGDVSVPSGPSAEGVTAAPATESDTGPSLRLEVRSR
jgi:hypothetical protein